MEKYSSKIGVLTFVIFILACLMTIVSFMVWIITGIWAFSLVMGLVLVVLVIPAFFGTNYSLTEEAIVVNCGIFAVNKEINYKDIIAISPTINHVLAPSLNSERVMVAYMKNNQLKRTYLSPCAFDRFICRLSDIFIEKTTKEEVLLPVIGENLANKETEKVENAETKPKVRKISKSTKDKNTAESAASTKHIKLTLTKADNKTSKQEEKPKAKTTNKKQTSKAKETKNSESTKETNKKKTTSKQTTSKPKKTVKASKDEIVSEIINTKKLDENIEKIVSLLEQTTSQIDEISTQSINETKNKKSGKKAQNKVEAKQTSSNSKKAASTAKTTKKTEEKKVSSKTSSKNAASKKQPIKAEEKPPQKKTVVRKVKKEN